MIVDLENAHVDAISQVGGKASGLGAMLRAKERVPPGFCLTTDAHRSGNIPEAELAAAYARLGEGPVAVRSSATAEDLPDASFAGQQETLLNVEGVDALVSAVRACWDSLETRRAAVYRDARGFGSARMAVVVQRMVEPVAAGVLFTANPVTGARGETVVDAAPGLGTAVVDGTVNPERHVLDGTPPVRDEAGLLSAEHLDALYRAGQRLQDLFGVPQDVEWAIDDQDRLWLLQSRSITTLFPLPPAGDGDQLRAFVELGSKQGMIRPFTPLGASLVTSAMSALVRATGLRTDPTRTGPALVELAGRFYFDLTDLLRNSSTRDRVARSLGASFGQRAAQAVERLLTDPRFAPRPGPSPRRMLARPLARYGPGIVAGTCSALLSPERARKRAFGALDRARAAAAPPAALAGVTPGRADERLRRSRDVLGEIAREALPPTLPPVFAALVARALPKALLRGVVRDDEVDAVLRGAPHNVTTDMDLRLWRVAQDASAHRDLLLDSTPSELATLWRTGELPEFGLTAFLDEYGHRAAAEVDVGIPRWSEDPGPVLASIANYLRVTDPDQAPDLRFATAARDAEDALDALARRARTARPVRGALAALLLRRARTLAGLREIPKVVELFALAEIRRQVLAIGTELAGEGVLEHAEDVVYLTLPELESAVAQRRDQRALVEERRESYQREVRRPYVPTVLLSDGTDVEAALPRPPAPDGALGGVAAAPGDATGRARVVTDPTTAHVEPGEILVAPTTDPGWTPLFLTAAGLVSETGSAVAHGPTVAREYGIPAVVGVHDATRRIESGDMITIDGAAGTVVIHESASAQATPA